MGKRGPMAKNKLTVAEPCAVDKKQQLRYMAEDDMRTLQRAQEIQSSKDRMSNVKSYANEQIKTLSKVAK